MRLFLSALLVMAAFSANAVINRFALVNQAIDPASFAIIRVFSATFVLAILVAAQRSHWKTLTRWRPVSAVALAISMVGVSFAFLSLSAHVGALILFGGIQLTLFMGGALGRRKFSAWQWLGMIGVVSGLAWLAWPDTAITFDLTAAGYMVAAAVCWGIYSLIEQRADDPLGSGAANFTFAAPLTLIGLFLTTFYVSPVGIALALLSGILTTGFAFALWYTLLTKLRVSSAARAQICVPILSAYGGVLFIEEQLDFHFIIAAILVIGGVTFSATRQPHQPMTSDN